MQAEFFGLLGLADKASAGLEQEPQRGTKDDGSHHSPASNIEYDSVYVETGFHPVKSEFGALQQQQAATMQVRFADPSLCLQYVCCPANLTSDGLVCQPSQ